MGWLMQALPISWTIIFWVVSYGMQIATVIRVLTREHREPVSRLAWIFFIMAVPVLGMFIYLLFGETNFGSKTVDRMHRINTNLPRALPNDKNTSDHSELALNFRQAFARARSVNGFANTYGNTGTLLADSNASIAEIVADIDQARDHVHLLFYIWLLDANGKQVIEAVTRASKRGVKCRCMVDGVGSSTLAKSNEWAALQKAGVMTAIAFPITFLPFHIFFGRVDVRNHRKIVVIDNEITYCGSQNCADPDFSPKPKYGPWVDVMVRLTGPIVWQQQHIFVSDWIAHSGEDISDYLQQPHRPTPGGFPAVAIGSGPSEDFNSVPDIFQNLVSSAQEEIVIATPYFVPSEALHQRICAASIRGVRVKFILPERNDSTVVAWASRSYYLPLLRSGVELFEFQAGLLHSKTLIVDRSAIFWGSANLDRRSFDINFENCILAIDRELAAQFIERQDEYIAQSRAITLEEVESWSMPSRVRNNLVAVLGPLL